MDEDVNVAARQVLLQGLLGRAEHDLPSVVKLGRNQPPGAGSDVEGDQPSIVALGCAALQCDQKRERADAVLDAGLNDQARLHGADDDVGADVAPELDAALDVQSAMAATAQARGQERV